VERDCLGDKHHRHRHDWGYALGDDAGALKGTDGRSRCGNRPLPFRLAHLSL
jgi:hypothetical protein